MKICIIGDSKRHDGAIQCLRRQNIPYFQIKSCAEIPEKIDADYVIFPIPTTKNGVLNLIDNKNTVPESIMKTAKESTFAITCNYALERYRYTDINTRDDFAYLNAVPTAEGAIHLATNSSDKTLASREVIILGFGRVGKILANRLFGIGANPTIGARSLKDIYYAKALGFKTIELCNLKEKIYNFDTVFQTIPAKILDNGILDSMQKDSVIIELSSKMQGTDLKAAEDLGIRVIDGTGLPEKIAPYTAGQIWADTVLKIIEEHKKSLAGEFDG